MSDNVYRTKFTRKITWDEDTMKVSDSVTSVWNDAISTIRDGLDKQMEDAVCNHFDLDMSDLRAYMHDKIAWERKQEVAIPKWIPVTERLPDKMNRVLVYSKLQGIRSDFLCSDGSGWYSTALVTHWKPLPEPPKEDENEGC